MSDTPAKDQQLENHRQLTPPSISIPTSLSEAKSRLQPATSTAGTAELMACLTLVAPSGMSAEDRNAWVQVARATLTGIPGDLLAVGCKEARRRCRFASEIVPTILDAVESLWESRKYKFSIEQTRYTNRDRPKIEYTPPEYIAAAEVRKLIKSLVK